MKYQLVNFDLGNPPIQRQFSIGPYEIEVVDDYEDHYPEMPHSGEERVEYGTSEDRIVREVTHDEATFGAPMVMATASCENEPKAELISETLGTADTSAIWDLCLILSHVSGRRVFLPDQARRFRHVSHGEAAVQPQNIPAASQVAWQNRGNFPTEKSRRPLWNRLYMNDLPEAELKLLIGCVSLEIIQNVEQSDDNQQTESEELEDLRDEVMSDIDASGVDEDLKHRLKSAVGKWGGSGAQEQFKQFMVSYGVVSPGVDGVQRERVRDIFSMRNGVVHSGELRKPSWPDSEESRIRAATIVIGAIIPYLVEEYVNRRFDLMDFHWPSQNVNRIKEYVLNGSWNGNSIG